MKKVIWIISICLVMANTCLFADETDDLFIAKRVVDKKWSNYELSSVRLSAGSDFKTMQDKHLAYLLKLDPERLLNNVLRGGDIPTTAENYGGWQHNNGNGFSNYLSGCSMMYASTGDERLMERIVWMIDQIALCQEKENLDGFFYFSRDKGLGAYNQLMSASGNGVYPSNNGEDFYTNGAMAGMAFYQLHRIFYGIRDTYYYTKYEKAKTVFIKCMEWACKWTDLIPDDTKLQIALEAEHGGMSELFVDAYALTGNTRFLDNADRWTHTLNFRDQVANRKDVLTSRHANVYDPKYMGLINNYEFTGNEANRDAAINVWDMVAHDHTLPMGGHGRWERYGEPGKLLDQLANTSAETCCTNNMLRFSKSMFSVFGDAKYLDYYEKALYNHILASRDPDNNTIGGGFCYYQSLMPGQCRKYMDDHSFYCCWETGLENHSKYGEAVYFENGKDVLVNLYIPSILNDKEKGLVLQMDTKYPASDQVTITLTEVGDFNGNILFRCPGWIDAGKVNVSVNNQVQNLSFKAGTLVALTGSWKKGDVIKLLLPSELRYESSDEPNVAALFYGPLTLAADLGAASNDYISNVWDQQGDTQLELCPDFPNLNGPKSDLSSWIKREAGEGLRFKTEGLSSVYEFLPYYKAHHRRTSIYQRFVNQDDLQWENRYVTDRILINVNEVEHQYSGRALTDVVYNRYYKKAKAGTSFSYTVKVSSDNDVQHWVAVKYQGWETEDFGNYDVYIDDVNIGSENDCERVQQFTFPTRFFKIPLSLTNGKDEVRLKITLKDKDMNFFGFMIVTDDYLKEWYPDSKKALAIDFIPMRLEAEDAQPHGDNRTFDGASSASVYISRLSSYLQFKDVFISQAGKYKVSVCYRSSKSTKQILTINNSDIELSCSTTDNDWKLIDTEVELEQGFNEIRFAPSSVRNPVDIDYFEIIPLSGVSVRTDSYDSGFEVYPNPAKEIVHFYSSIPEWRGRISIKDILGRILLSFQYPEQESLTLDQFPNGTYLVCFEANNRSDTTKLMINK